MRATAVQEVHEQYSLIARQSPTCPLYPPGAYTRVNGGDGVPFKSISHSLLLCGDASRALELLPNESVQTVLTSPPYWSLRDYDIENQIGRRRQSNGLHRQHRQNLRKAEACSSRRWHGMAQHGRRIHVGESPLSSTGPKESSSCYGSSPSNTRRIEGEGPHWAALAGSFHASRCGMVDSLRSNLAQTKRSPRVSQRSAHEGA